MRSHWQIMTFLVIIYLEVFWCKYSKKFPIEEDLCRLLYDLCRFLTIKEYIMLPSTPPPVSKYGTYSIDETCALLGCCRDTLRKRTEIGRIKSDRLDEDTENIIYYAKEILRYWFNATKQPKTDGELDLLINQIQEQGYEATFGCKPPVTSQKKAKSAKAKDVVA